MNKLEQFLALEIPHYPIPFAGDMVQSIILGSKSQTRRDWGLKEINQNPGEWKLLSLNLYKERGAPSHKYPKANYLAVFQKIGTKKKLQVKLPWKNLPELLWVRETWQYECDHIFHAIHGHQFKKTGKFLYQAKGDYLQDSVHALGFSKWKPSIHMPKEASRIWLQLTGVRIERLEDISDKDAIAEGIARGYLTKEQTGETLVTYKNYMTWQRQLISPATSFLSLWQSLYGSGSLLQNPWVWVFEFTPVSFTGLSDVLTFYKQADL